MHEEDEESIISPKYMKQPFSLFATHPSYKEIYFRREWGGRPPILSLLAPSFRATELCLLDSRQIIST